MLYLIIANHLLSHRSLQPTVSFFVGPSETLCVDPLSLAYVDNCNTLSGNLPLYGTAQSKLQATIAVAPGS